MSENMLSMLEPDKWTTGQMDRIPTGPQLNWTARHMVHNKMDGPTIGAHDEWTTAGPHWVLLYRKRAETCRTASQR